jgi:ribosomal protein L13E
MPEKEQKVSRPKRRKKEEKESKATRRRKSSLKVSKAKPSSRVKGADQQGVSQEATVERAGKVPPIGFPPHSRIYPNLDSRLSRGFSVSEIREAGLTFQRAKSLGIIIDPRRKSSKQGNKDLLTSWVGKTQATAGAKEPA